MTVAKKRTKNRTAVIVTFPGTGGFPVKNINYWKEVKVGPLLTYEDKQDHMVLRVFFKSGGQMDLNGVTTEEFGSLIYGIPY